MELQVFMNLPEMQALDLVSFYTKFIATFSTRLNQLSFVRLVSGIPRQIQGMLLTPCSSILQFSHSAESDKKIEFFKAISELPKVVAHDEAFIESRANLATCHIQSGELAAAKVRREAIGNAIESGAIRLILLRRFFFFFEYDLLHC